MSNKDKATWLARHYHDVAEGGKSQYTNGDGWHDADGGLCFHSIEYEWRVVMPTVLTPVDMSVLVGSGIDCEFWDLKGVYNGHLVAITSAPEYRAIGDFWDRCKPRMNYWFSCKNFKSSSTIVENLELAGFVVESCIAFTHFQITGIAEGRCWPWEQVE
jgi:hypothetical protein